MALLLALPASIYSQDVATAGDRARCACPEPTNEEEPTPGVVWQGAADSTLDLKTMAEMLAPILWFSSDEPLLLRNGGPVPQAHPSDAPSESAVVYYQVLDLVLRGDERIEGKFEEELQFFEKVAQFRLKYFFYYGEDVGMKPHRHDLEAIELRVYLDETGDGCRRIRVTRIEGLAHGLSWYSNILSVEADTVFPVTVLVEEGKHASAPDRNGDGVYTPGYDTNVRINDAWGLRDIMGSSVLQGSRYTASMSKPRDEAFRLLPPRDVELCGRRPPARLATAGLGRYALRPAVDVPASLAAVPDAKRLDAMMRFHHFGPDAPARQYPSSEVQALSDPENVYRVISGFNLRWDTDRIGGSLQGPGFDLREVWVVPRLLLMDGWAAEAIITPSASRWVDWYAAVGYERGIVRIPTGDGREPQLFNGFASEAGLKFRVALPGKARWAALGYRFSGIRIGIRSSGFGRIQEPRFVIEIGAGAF
jgi:hypothetical protein